MEKDQFDLKAENDRLRAALIEHLDLYWGEAWKTADDQSHPAYARLDRARKALAR